MDGDAVSLADRLVSLPVGSELALLGSVSKSGPGCGVAQPPPGDTPVTAGYNPGIRPRPARPQPAPEPRLAPTPTSTQTLVESLDPADLRGEEVVALLTAEHRLANWFAARVRRSQALQDAARAAGGEAGQSSP